MITPSYLKPGDEVGIVCTASFINGSLDYAIKIIESWGLKVHVGQHVNDRFHTFAGDDTARTADFQQFIDNDRIKAIFAARGGYGTVRIIDKIDFETFIRQPKWIIGFSDITVLHSHIHTKFDTSTIHGQMPKTFDGGTQTSIESLRKALFGELKDQNYISRISLNRSGEGEGQLIGGNLAILHSLMGSDSEVDFDGKILFLEDVGEQHYNVDRMMWTLRRARKLDKLHGLIIGGFSHMKDSNPSFGQNAYEIIHEKVKDFNYPVAFSYPAGHIDNNHALILGKKVKLAVENQNVTLTYF